VDEYKPLIKTNLIDLRNVSGQLASRRECRMKSFFGRAQILLTFVAIGGIATGCAITDPDWQARADAKPGMEPTTPPPPQQWSPGWGTGDGRAYGNLWGE
jgi:hypothetical protein